MSLKKNNKNNKNKLIILMLKKLNINIIFYTINIIIVLMDKKVIFERAEKKDNKELYLPDDEHIDFHVYANEAIKEKETYSYVNRDGYLVGKFISMMPNNAAKKVLRRIYMYTKNIKSYILHI